MTNLKWKQKKMWIVAKIKSEELRLFKNQLSDQTSGEARYYEPKITFFKNNVNTVKNILGNYIFCFHEKFKDYSFVNKFKYIRGLKYFLKDYKNSQKNILNFINFCKSNEDKSGFLNAGFFKKVINNKGKFLNGPLANMVFEILENNKNNLTINIGHRTIKLKDKFKIFYLPV